MAEQAYKLLIGGNLVDGDSTMDVVNPATLVIDVKNAPQCKGLTEWHVEHCFQVRGGATAADAAGAQLDAAVTV